MPSGVDEFAEGPLQRCRFSLRDGDMAGLRFGEQNGPPRPALIFLHATGFNARTYRALLAPLGEFWQILAVDLRGHGRTSLPLPTRAYTSWEVHAEDVLGLLDAHIPGPVILAGHSMGAIVALLAAARRPQTVRALCLIEPVLLPPVFYLLGKVPGADYLRRRFGPMRQAAKRRAQFASLEEAQARLTGRGVFAAFSPDTLRDYLADGLRPAGDGVELACSSAFEAATFAAQGHAPYAALGRVRCAIRVLRAANGSTFLQRSVNMVAARWPDLCVETLPGTSHMLPMEQPERVRAVLAQMLGDHQSLD
jgi:pimeloyl-ACP methyl ester carboxylesterase